MTSVSDLINTRRVCFIYNCCLQLTGFQHPTEEGAFIYFLYLYIFRHLKFIAQTAALPLQSPSYLKLTAAPLWTLETLCIEDLKRGVVLFPSSPWRQRSFQGEPRKARGSVLVWTLKTWRRNRFSFVLVPSSFRGARSVTNSSLLAVRTSSGPEPGRTWQKGESSVMQLRVSTSEITFGSPEEPSPWSLTVVAAW